MATLGLLTVLLLWPLSQLRLSTDLTRLLPADTPSVRAFRSLMEDFGGAEAVFVLVRAGSSPGGATAKLEKDTSTSENELLEAAWLLEELLGQRGDLVARARTGIAETEEAVIFEQLLPAAVLLLDDPDWQAALADRTTAEALRDRARLIRRQASLQGGELFVQIARSDPLGLSELVPALALAAGTGLPTEPLTGSFLSRQGDAALVIVEPAVEQLGGVGARRFAEMLEQTMDEVERRLPFALELTAVGGPLYAAADEQAVRSNLLATVGTSVVGCALVLVLVFGSWRIPLIVVGTVLVGMTWLFAMFGLIGVEISAIGLGFAAVLVGLGVDYGVHSATAYREELVAGRLPEDAWRKTADRLGRAVATSALTTAMAFAVLLFADLRLLRDVGLVVALGILLVAAAAWTLGASLLQLVVRGEQVGRAPLWIPLERWTARCVEVAGRGPRATLWGAAVVTAVLALGAWQLQLSTDLRGLRPSGAGLERAERAVAESFGLGSDTATLIVEGVGRDEVLHDVRRLATLLRRETPAGSQVLAPSELLVGPRTLEARLRELSDLQLGAVASRFEEALRAEGLAPAAFEAGLDGLRALGRGEAPSFLQPGDRSVGAAWLQKSVRDSRDGRVRAMIQLRLPSGQWEEGPPAALMEAIRRTAPGAVWASFPLLAGDLGAAALHDVALLGPLSLLVVALVVWLSFGRRLWPTVAALLPVGVSSVCLLGIWGWSFGTLDLVSLVVLPIVLGIGIDDGLHAVHRACGPGIDAPSDPRGEPESEALATDLARSVAGVGRAMAVTTLTTCVGFGSLLLSNIEGVRRAGLVVGGGVALCLFATLFLLPAIGAMRSSNEK